MSQANALWGAPRIHGELLKLGVDVSQATVAKYMARRATPPSQTWRTFLANHLQQIAAADFFVVPTATCRLLFVLVILAHERRRVVHVAVTDHPTAAWTAQQLREAFSWDEAPRYLVHDRDSAFHCGPRRQPGSASRNSSRLHVRHGKTPTRSARSDPFAANASITSSSATSAGYAASCTPMSRTTYDRALTCRSTKMHRSLDLLRRSRTARS
jgi:hypothetical protein